MEEEDHGRDGRGERGRDIDHAEVGGGEEEEARLAAECESPLEETEGLIQGAVGEAVGSIGEQEIDGDQRAEGTDGKNEEREEHQEAGEEKESGRREVG